VMMAWPREGGKRRRKSSSSSGQVERQVLVLVLRRRALVLSQAASSSSSSSSREASAGRAAQRVLLHLGRALSSLRQAVALQMPTRNHRAPAVRPARANSGEAPPVGTRLAVAPALAALATQVPPRWLQLELLASSGKGKGRRMGPSRRLLGPQLSRWLHQPHTEGSELPEALPGSVTDAGRRERGVHSHVGAAAQVLQSIAACTKHAAI
jgi:hypothetical protein